MSGVEISAARTEEESNCLAALRVNLLENTLPDYKIKVQDDLADFYSQMVHIEDGEFIYQYVLEQYTLLIPLLNRGLSLKSVFSLSKQQLEKLFADLNQLKDFFPLLDVRLVNVFEKLTFQDRTIFIENFIAFYQFLEEMPSFFLQEQVTNFNSLRYYFEYKDELKSYKDFFEVDAFYDFHRFLSYLKLREPQTVQCILRNRDAFIKLVRNRIFPATILDSDDKKTCFLLENADKCIRFMNQYRKTWNFLRTIPFNNLKILIQQSRHNNKITKLLSSRNRHLLMDETKNPLIRDFIRL